MKFVLIFATLVVLVSAHTKIPSNVAHILKYENDNIGLGNYKYSYETSDGTSRQESAELIHAGGEEESLVVRGFYSWIADDGHVYTVNYIADENGFQPQGDHIPQ